VTRNRAAVTRNGRRPSPDGNRSKLPDHNASAGCLPAPWIGRSPDAASQLLPDNLRSWLAARRPQWAWFCSGRGRADCQICPGSFPWQKAVMFYTEAPHPRVTRPGSANNIHRAARRRSEATASMNVPRSTRVSGCRPASPKAISNRSSPNVTRI
jgi:hypothetical protein